VFTLHVILILCTVAVLGVAFAVYRLVRVHMRGAHHDPTPQQAQEHREKKAE
jgi:hypothetical protein